MNFDTNLIKISGESRKLWTIGLLQKIQILEPLQFWLSVFYHFTVVNMVIENPENLIKYLSGFGRYDCLNFDNSKYGNLREKC